MFSFLLGGAVQKNPCTIVLCYIWQDKGVIFKNCPRILKDVNRGNERHHQMCADGERGPPSALADILEATAFKETLLCVRVVM